PAEDADRQDPAGRVAPARGLMHGRSATRALLPQWGARLVGLAALGAGGALQWQRLMRGLPAGQGGGGGGGGVGGPGGGGGGGGGSTRARARSPARGSCAIRMRSSTGGVRCVCRGWRWAGVRGRCCCR